MKMNKPYVIMMVGPSYSGKSTVALDYAKKFKAEIFSSDAIREELYGDAGIQRNHGKVFDLLHSRLKETLREGKSAIYDATNLSMKRRVSFLKNLENEKIACQKMAVVVVASLEDIDARRLTRERVVPDEVVLKQLKNFQCPYYYEGWDEIYVEYTSTYNSCVKCFDNIMVRCGSLSHDNPHHTLCVGGHMIAASEYQFNHFPGVCAPLVFAIRYHDVGKFHTKTFTNMRGERTEIAHYYGHQNVGAYLILMSQGMALDSLLYAAVLVQFHMEHFISNEERMKKLEENLSPYGLDRCLKILNECDINAH